MAALPKAPLLLIPWTARPLARDCQMETELGRVSVPTLILVGDEDAPVLRVSDFLAKTLARARLIIFPETGHTLNLEEPTQFNKATREFLAS